MNGWIIQNSWKMAKNFYIWISCFSSIRVNVGRKRQRNMPEMPETMQKKNLPRSFVPRVRAHSADGTDFQSISSLSSNIDIDGNMAYRPFPPLHHHLNHVNSVFSLFPFVCVRSPTTPHNKTIFIHRFFTLLPFRIVNAPLLPPLHVQIGVTVHPYGDCSSSSATAAIPAYWVLPLMNRKEERKCQLIGSAGTTFVFVADTCRNTHIVISLTAHTIEIYIITINFQPEKSGCNILRIEHILTCLKFNSSVFFFSNLHLNCSVRIIQTSLFRSREKKKLTDIEE